MTAPSTSQPNAPDRDITVDFAIAVERLHQLGVSVHHSTTIVAPEIAAWSKETRTFYLRHNATFWAKLWLLADFHALLTKPGYVSPSVPVPRLTLVESAIDEPPIDSAQRRCWTRPRLTVART